MWPRGTVDSRRRLPALRGETAVDVLRLEITRSSSSRAARVKRQRLFPLLPDEIGNPLTFIRSFLRLQLSAADSVIQ